MRARSAAGWAAIQARARSVTKPGLQPGRPALLASCDGMPASSSRRSVPAGRVDLEGERQLRAEEGAGLEADAGRVREHLGQEHQRRNPDAAADQQGDGPRRVGPEALADGAQHAHRVAGFGRRQRLQALADDLVEHFHPALGRVGPQDRQGPAHRDAGRALHVDEGARGGGAGAVRRVEPGNVLAARVDRLLQDLRFDRRRWCRGGICSCTAGRATSLQSHRRRGRPRRPVLTFFVRAPLRRCSRSRDSASTEVSRSSMRITGSW